MSIVYIYIYIYIYTIQAAVLGALLDGPPPVAPQRVQAPPQARQHPLYIYIYI